MATQQSRPRIGVSTSRSLRIARWECWCYHPTLLSPSASFILGEKKWKVKKSSM
ncbi:hypothetical protein [Leptospira interrogans]|uniref:hypothetical protein n=1 Tax=Leptospira interrogans TaxID=173 RepID=UPI001E63E5C5|nr:hypothetical protein [Leptospira interrogans]